LAAVTKADSTEDFTWLPEGLEPVALRLARADECAFKIGDLTSKWSADGPLELEQVRQGDRVQMFLRSMRPIPPAASLLFSEAVNHLRAAIDNVVWYLIEQEHGHLEGPTAPLVNMPILESQEKLDNWTKRRLKEKIAAFGAETTLGRRLRTLQPFVDLHSGVPSMSKALAGALRQEVETAHPLRLLQAYSNADKHRSVRIALARTFISSDSAPLAAQDLAHQEIKVGEPMGPATTWGEVSILETNTAVMVRRPSPFEAWVNPVTDINAIRSHVGNVVVPILLTGLEMPRALPPAIDLGDNGRTARQRIGDGKWDTADARLRPILQARYIEAERREVQVAPVVERNEPTTGDDPT